MQIDQNDYSKILELLRSDKKAEASEFLMCLIQAPKSEVDSIIEHLLVKERIEVPVKNTVTLNTVPIAATLDDVDQVKLELDTDDARTPIWHHVISGLCAPLVITGIIGGILAVFAYFGAKLFITNKELKPVQRWGGVGLVLFIPYFVYFGFIREYSAPYAIDRNTVVELPKYLIPAKEPSDLPLDVQLVIEENGYKVTGGNSNSFTGDGLGLPVVTADSDLNYKKDALELKIIAIGFHESSAVNGNITYYDPQTNKELVYPFFNDGYQIKFEDIINEKKEKSVFTVNSQKKVNTYQNKRLLRIVYTCSEKYSIGDFSLVERETNQFLTNTGKSIRSKRIGSEDKRVSGLSLELKNWHAPKWDLYVNVHSTGSNDQHSVPLKRGSYPLGNGTTLQIAGVINNKQWISPRYSIEKDTFYPLKNKSGKPTVVARILPGHLARYSSLYNFGNQKPNAKLLSFGKQSDWVEFRKNYTEDGNMRVRFSIPTAVVKFELPHMQQFEVKPYNQNLLDVKIPYYKRITTPRPIANYANEGLYLEASRTGTLRFIEDLAQMTHLKVDPKIYEMKIRDTFRKEYKDTTPYKILKDFADDTDLKLIIDEKNLMLSFKYKKLTLWK